MIASSSVTADARDPIELATSESSCSPPSALTVTKVPAGVLTVMLIGDSVLLIAFLSLIPVAVYGEPAHATMVEVR